MAARRRLLVRRGIAATVALVLLALGLAGPALARPARQAARRPPVPAVSLDRMTVTAADNAVLRWNAVALQAIRDTAPPPPVAARALAVLHTAMFDAWAAYDRQAVGTRLGTRLRRPAAEQTPANKRAAVSYAAYRALADLFPARLADLQAADFRCEDAEGISSLHRSARQISPADGQCAGRPRQRRRRPPATSSERMSSDPATLRHLEE